MSRTLLALLVSSASYASGQSPPTETWTHLVMAEPSPSPETTSFLPPEVMMAFQQPSFATFYPMFRGALCTDNAWNPSVVLILKPLLPPLFPLMEAAPCFCGWSPDLANAGTAYETLFSLTKASMMGAGPTPNPTVLLGFYMTEFQQLLALVGDLSGTFSCSPACKNFTASMYTDWVEIAESVGLSQHVARIRQNAALADAVETEVTSMVSASVDCGCGIDYVQLVSYASPMTVMKILMGAATPMDIMQLGNRVTATALAGVCSSSCQAAVSHAVSLSLGILMDDQMQAFLRQAMPPAAGPVRGSATTFSAALVGVFAFGIAGLALVLRRRQTAPAKSGAADAPSMI